MSEIECMDMEEVIKMLDCIQRNLDTLINILEKR